MHELQVKLLNLAKHQDLSALSLRQIAKLVEVPNKPQLVKHHLQQLSKSGLLQVNFDKGIIKSVSRGFNSTVSAVKSLFYSLPIVGSANCGPATIFADQRIEGYLKVSASMLPRRRNDLFVLIADGNSMDLAKVRKNLTIEDGDFVVVDSGYRSPKHNDIVVAVIDGMATIKHYKEDEANGRIILEAESTEKHLPIFVNQGDDFVISGRVVDVIKKVK